MRVLLRSSDRPSCGHVAEPRENVVVDRIQRQCEQFHLLVQEHLHHRPPAKFTVGSAEKDGALRHLFLACGVEGVVGSRRGRGFVVSLDVLAVVTGPPPARIAR